MNVNPITPNEICQEIPDWVIEGANNCIKKHWVELNQESHFTQEELISEIIKVYDKKNPQEQKTHSCLRTMLFDRHYLDIEPIYEKVGWKVEYDKPSYYETYEANFTFYKKK